MFCKKLNVRFWTFVQVIQCNIMKRVICFCFPNKKLFVNNVFVRFFRRAMECSVPQIGLLNESVCKKPIRICTDPISDKYNVEARPFAR